MHQQRSAVPDDSAKRAFLWACELDVAARKPGNVSFASAGHGMQAALFIASAAAAADFLFASGTSVGERIERAVRATWTVAGCNTNLGIVLLCAPLARVSEQMPASARMPDWRQTLEQVLERLDLDDARAAYRAIALAHPGGLGTASEQDVAEPPTVTLREAMALAADRDRIAFQYAHAFPDVFELGVPAFQATLRDRTAGGSRSRERSAEPAAVAAMQRAFLEFLAAIPDSHIVRKHGAQTAQSVMAEACDWRDRARAGQLLDADPAFAAWDDSLKARGLNPGTSADLCVAAAMVARMLDAGEHAPQLAEPSGAPSAR